MVWPGLINQWIYCPDEHGQYLGTLSRGSTPQDVEHMLEGEDLGAMDGATRGNAVSSTAGPTGASASGTSPWGCHGSPGSRS